MLKPTFVKIMSNKGLLELLKSLPQLRPHSHCETEVCCIKCVIWIAEKILLEEPVSNCVLVQSSLVQPRMDSNLLQS